MRVDAGARDLFEREAVMRVPGVGRAAPVLRQELGAFPGGDDAKTAGARPVDQLTDQCGLIAVGHRVDDAGPLGFVLQDRPDDDVGFDRDHDDVMPMLDRAERVQRPRFDKARRFNDDIHVACGCDFAGRHERGLPFARDVVSSRGAFCRYEAVGVPARSHCGAARAFDVEIGEHGEMHAFHQVELREDHRAELSGADERNAHGSARLRQGLKLRCKIHKSIDLRRRAAVSNRGRPSIPDPPFHFAERASIYSTPLGL